MIGKILEVIDPEDLVTAIYNNNPDLVEDILAPVPDHCPLYLIYYDFPLHHIAMFIEIVVADYKNNKAPDDKPFYNNQKIKKLLAQKFAVNYNEEIPFYEYGLNGELDADGEESLRRKVFKRRNLRKLENFETTILDMELYIAARTFNFDRVRLLLEQGAKPDVEVFPDEMTLKDDGEYDDPGSAISDIENEIVNFSNYCDTAFFYNCEPIEFIDDNVRWLATLAANKNMLAVLKPYCRKEIE